ncbi:MAG: methyltransferase domain-containing protein [Betaproteobacteria bacterium]
MTAPLEFTGERFVPGLDGEIAHEHWHRYAFARRFVAGRRVADVACGEGYGSALLAASAGSVVGIDVDAASIAHAVKAYGTTPKLRFVEGTASALPLADACVDAVVSFETVEHLAAADQPRMIAEFARVLAPGGLLVLSSPNRPEYSDARGYANPFHVHELDRGELERVLVGAFPAQRWYRQRRYLGSALWGEDGAAPSSELLEGDGRSVDAARAPAAMYFVVVAAREAAALSSPGPALSLFTDRDEREWARLDAQAREVLRQDALVKERDAALTRQTAHILHLEQLVAERDRVVEERDRRLAGIDAERLRFERDTNARELEIADLRQQIDALQAERARLERALGAQERIIAYRQSARWWFALPLVRTKLLWKRMGGN